MYLLDETEEEVGFLVNQPQERTAHPNIQSLPRMKIKIKNRKRRNRKIQQKTLWKKKKAQYLNGKSKMSEKILKIEEKKKKESKIGSNGNIKQDIAEKCILVGF